MSFFIDSFFNLKSSISHFSELQIHFKKKKKTFLGNGKFLRDMTTDMKFKGRISRPSSFERIRPTITRVN